MSTLVTETVTATVPALSLTLSVTEASITLDESASPYVQAELTVHTPAQSEALDPRDNLRVTLVVGQAWQEPVRAAQSRTFNLLLHERRFDHETGLTRLLLVSDEALLIDAGLVANAPDTSAVTYQTSLRAIINNVVLSDFGASLQAGTQDADFTQVWAVENLVTNPTFAADTAGWVTAATQATVSRNAGTGFGGGAGYIQSVSNGSGSVGIHFGEGGYQTTISCRPGDVFTFSVYLSTGTTGKTARVAIRYTDGVDSLRDFSSSTVTLTAGTWTRVSVTGTCPEGMSGMSAYAVGDFYTAGQALYGDAAMLTEGPVLWPYFNGSTVADAYYTYSWSDAANLSTSRRTPKSDRDPDAIIWEPGTKAWDYLQPLFESAGLRLFCDESRKWWLVNSSAYTVAGQVNLSQANNLTRAEDTISRREEWFDSVVIRYRWDDSAGASHTAYDSAGTSGGVTRLVEWERPYPGAGAAASILERAQGRGRTLALEALSDLTTTPGMSLVASLPNTPIQTGVVGNVTWSFSADGESGVMRLGSRGLTDTPATAWALAPATRTWATSTGSWVTYSN